jgi:hypothetical protein
MEFCRIGSSSLAGAGLFDNQTEICSTGYRQRKTPGACFRRGGAGAYTNNLAISVLMVNPFFYSQSVIKALERALSSERLSTYLAAAGGDQAAALRLHVWNTRISAALYGPLQALEIIIRNAFHRELSVAYGPAWYDNTRLPLTPAARARVADAKEAVRRAGRPLDPGRIVAELSFGFWERLLTHGPPGRLNYEMALWRPALHRAFPNSRRRRADVHKPLPGLRDLRNRIAHHEPIFSRDLAADYQTILDVISWMCTDTQAWVVHHSNVPTVLTGRP